ncbi:uncharacterized protein LOC123539626 [Mercenaria mercenaria]|uniref:uncharacterized protein LOC123539626 n=1 Tax=Mercenaria mercenaria TaxID=6596 RepID=UPI00234FA362|nr:uncharacterized protein LOC123539626 [Mercenaria mercenaria]
MEKDGSGAEASKDGKKKKKSWFKKKFWKSDSPAEKSKGTAEKSKGSSIFNVEKETTFSIDEKQSFVDKIATTDLIASAEENVTTEVLLTIPKHFKQSQDKSQPSKTECEYSAQLNDDKTEMSESGDFEPGKAARNRISTKITGKQQTCRQAAKSDRFSRESITRHSLQLKQLQSTGGGLVEERKRLLALKKRRTSPATRAKRNHRQKKNNQKEDIEDSSEEYVTTDDKTGSEDYSRGVNESDKRMDTSGKRMPPEGACVKPDTTQATIKHNKTFSEEGFVKKDNEANESHCSAVTILNHVPEAKEELTDERKRGMFVEDKKRLLSTFKRNPSRGTLVKLGSEQQVQVTNALKRINFEDIKLPRNDKTRSADNLQEERLIDRASVEDTKSLRESLKQDSTQIQMPNAQNHSGVPSNYETRCADSHEEERKYNWMTCIGNDDVEQAQRLLQDGVLPNAEELDKMCHKNVFRRNANVLIEACNHICENIQCKFDKSAEDVWPGFPATEIRNDESRHCTFIIVSNEDIDLSEIMYRCVKIPSKRKVRSSKKEPYHVPHSPCQLHELKKVENIIYEHEQTLMEKHKFLTMISASQYRCSGQTPNVKRTDGLCIVLWVQYKGYVPINEEPFQEKYGGVAVDVREGSFNLFSGGAETYQDFLKMGCKISGESEGNKTPKGTLGGFIQHPKYGYCGITSAHCVLQPAEMKRLSCENGELNAEYPSFHGSVYQPDQNGGKVGNLVKAVCHKGNEKTNNVGLDLAVFRLCDRFPNSAKFPVDKNGNTLTYISGKTAGFPRPMANEEELMKFGMATGLTRGKLESEIALLSVRQKLRWTHGSGQSEYRIHLNRQLEFNGINELQFADYGDSGSLVFSDGHNGQGVLCVGMVVGGKNDETENKVSCVVTPIAAILKVLDVTGFRNFESGKLQADIEEIRADVKETKTEVKETKAVVEEILRELQGANNKLYDNDS